jgi:hypothetical protein
VKLRFQILVIVFVVVTKNSFIHSLSFSLSCVDVCFLKIINFSHIGVWCRTLECILHNEISLAFTTLLQKLCSLCIRLMSTSKFISEKRLKHSTWRARLKSCRYRNSSPSILNFSLNKWRKSVKRELVKNDVECKMKGKTHSLRSICYFPSFSFFLFCLHSQHSKLLLDKKRQRHWDMKTMSREWEEILKKYNKKTTENLIIFFPPSLYHS